MVNASNKVRVGDTRVSVIEGQVAFTFPSDKTQKGKPPAGRWGRSAGKDTRLGGFELELHWPRFQEVSPLWSDGAKLLCGLRPRWSRKVLAQRVEAALDKTYSLVQAGH
jgi:hypothetical protein